MENPSDSWLGPMVLAPIQFQESDSELHAPNPCYPTKAGDGLKVETKRALKNAARGYDVTRAVEKSLIGLAVLLTTTAALYDASVVLAQGQKTNYLWEGWHKVPEPSPIQYRVFHDKIVALSNLSKGCGPASSFSFAGKIAKVNFDSQGLRIENFVLETSDGERLFINVDKISLDEPGMNRADLSWIAQGLQTLLRPNSYIQGSALACGASGRVAMLDKILSASSKPISNSSNPTSLLPNGNSASQSQAQPAQTGGNSAEGIPLLAQGGTFVVPVLINGQITLNFTIDSGAADVSIPADVVSTLTRTGTIQESDFVGQKVYRLAVGSTVPSATFFIRLLKVGSHLLENVMGSVASAQADLLLGQSFLSRFNSWSIDNKRQVLLLN